MFGKKRYCYLSKNPLKRGAQINEVRSNAGKELRSMTKKANKEIEFW